MIIGVPTEIKPDEFRVAITPAGVRELVAHGHRVVIQSDAGEGSSIADTEYEAQGAEIVPDAEAVFAEAEMIMKVKEPQASELAMVESHHLVFTYLHLAAYPSVAQGLLASGCVAVAYETVELSGGRLPLLAPMSEVAGRMATQVGAYFLERQQGGRGVLLGGVTGVQPGKVVVIGAGIAGSNAATIAVGMQANVVALDRNLDKLRTIDTVYQGRIQTVFSSRLTIEEQLRDADLVIGSVLVPGASAPKLVTADMVKEMKKGAVMVDIAIDQGGCFETSRETTHHEPVYEVDGVVHYAVGNIPGAVPHTSTYALTNATLPYAVALADHGVDAARLIHPELASGVNVAHGHITHPAVAASLGMQSMDLTAALG